jgi:hypothetical protein
MLNTRSQGHRIHSLVALSLTLCLVVESGAAQAASTTVNIQGFVNANLQTYTNGANYPAGGTILSNAGVSFLLAPASVGGVGLGAIQTPSSPPTSSFDIPVNIPNPGAVYTLINSAFGAFGVTVGSMEFKATGGLDFAVALVEGQDIRDHNNDGFNNTIGTGAALGSIYINTFSFGNGVVRLDEQQFFLPASFNSATLTDIILNGTGSGANGEPFLAAATVSTPSAVPEPASLIMTTLGLGGISIAWCYRRFRHSTTASRS